MEGIREKIQAKISFYHAGKFQLWDIWCPSSATLYGRKRRRWRWRKQVRDARYVLPSVKTLLQTIAQTWATSFTINLYFSSTWLQLEVQIFIAEALRSCLIFFFSSATFALTLIHLVCPPLPTHKFCMSTVFTSVSLGMSVIPWRNWKQMLCIFWRGEEANEVYYWTKCEFKCDLRKIFFPFVRKASQIQTLLEHVLTQLVLQGSKQLSDGDRTRWRAKEIFARSSLLFYPVKNLGKKCNWSLFNFLLVNMIVFLQRDKILRYTGEELAVCSRKRVCVTGQHDRREWSFWPVKTLVWPDSARWPSVIHPALRRRIKVIV